MRGFEEVAAAAERMLLLPALPSAAATSEPILLLVPRGPADPIASPGRRPTAEGSNIRDFGGLCCNSVAAKEG